MKTPSLSIRDGVLITDADYPLLVMPVPMPVPMPAPMSIASISMMAIIVSTAIIVVTMMAVVMPIAGMIVII